MKQIRTIMIASLLLCNLFMPSVLAAEEPLDSTNTVSSIILTSFDEPYRTDAMAFAVGTSRDEVEGWFADVIGGFTGYDAEGNYYDFISGAWSLDAVDLDTPGVYYVYTTPDLGIEFTLADGVLLPKQLCAVSIQTPGKPEINCCVSGRGTLHFPWILSPEQTEQLDDFSVFLRKDSGEWTSLSENFWCSFEELQLYQRIFEYGSTYELKVTYPGGQTGVLTFDYDGELSILDYSGGDRDGGDASGNSSGPVTQLAPTPSITPNDSHENNPNIGYDSPIHNESLPKSNDTTQNYGFTSQEPDGFLQESEDTLQVTNDLLQEPQDTLQVTEDLLQEPQDTLQVPDDLSQETQDTLQVTEDLLQETQDTLQVPEGILHIPENTLQEPEGTPLERAKLKKTQSTSHNLDNTPIQIPVSEKTVTEVTQKEVDHKVSQQSTLVLEYYSKTETIISGLRLKDLCAEEENVVFGSGNLTISIPSKLLLSLNMSDTDTLSVHLSQPKSNQILLVVKVSDQLVTKLPGTVLRFAYMKQSEYSDITVQNEVGEQIPVTSYDGELLRFNIDKTGTYSILEISNEQEEQNTIPLLFPISGGLLLVSGGIVLFWRKCHG